MKKKTRKNQAISSLKEVSCKCKNFFKFYVLFTLLNVKYENLAKALSLMK